MLILTLRTDRPEAELGLFEDHNHLAYLKWQADRQLAETIHLKIKSLLQEGGRMLQDLGGVVVFKGPGSFTGLRIGITVANALAHGLGIPATGGGSDDWIRQGIEQLLNGESEIVTPEYGAPVHITTPKK